MYRRAFLLLLVLITGIALSNAQTYHEGIAGLPAKAKFTFTRQYKESTEVSWTVIDRFIAISFKRGNYYLEAFYNKDGKWLRTELPIEFSELPEPVKSSLNSKEFKSWHLGSSYRIYIPGKKIKYKVYIYSSNWDEMELLFDEKGVRMIDNLIY